MHFEYNHTGTTKCIGSENHFCSENTFLLRIHIFVAPRLGITSGQL